MEKLDKYAWAIIVEKGSKTPNPHNLFEIKYN